MESFHIVFLLYLMEMYFPWKKVSEILEHGCLLLKEEI